MKRIDMNNYRSLDEVISAMESSTCSHSPEEIASNYAVSDIEYKSDIEFQLDYLFDAGAKFDFQESLKMALELYSE